MEFGELCDGILMEIALIFGTFYFLMDFLIIGMVRLILMGSPILMSPGALFLNEKVYLLDLEMLENTSGILKV